MPHRKLKREWAANDFAFHIGQAVLRSSYPAHSHDYIELVIIEGGRSVHIAGQERHAVQAGDVFVVQGDLAHGFEDTEAMHFYNIMYDHSLLASAEGMLRRIPGYHALFVLEPHYRRRQGFTARLRLTEASLAKAISLCNHMRDEFTGNRIGREAAITAALLDLVTFVSREYGHVETPPAQQLLRIGEVISHLQTHYDEPVTLADLADMACVSQNTLLRHFKAATGTSPIRYVLQIRIDRARELLERTDLDVTDIAFRVGFEDSNYFSRQFRRLTGHSPSDHRRR
jgi:AraC-like DNA-binding protein